MKHTQAELEAALIPEKIKKLDEACRRAVDSFGHWTVGPVAFDKAKAGKVKSKAVTDWVGACWTQYYTNKAILEAGGVWDEAMLIYADKPHTAQEIMMEV
jgi:hypothetical protein